MEDVMEPNAPTEKLNWWRRWRRSPLRKKIRYILLIFLVVYSLLVLFDSFIQIRNYLEFNRMNDQRFQVSSLLNYSLVNFLAEPGERLTRSTCEDIGIEISTWANNHLDLIGIHSILGKDITNYLNRANSPVYQKIIEQNAISMMDTLHFYNCLWDSTCQLAHQWIEIENYRLLCSFFRTPKQTFLVVRDTEKLKKELSKILDDCRKQLYPFDYYFRPHEPFGAQIKFFDEGYNNFLTYGNPTGKGWERIHDQKFPFLPWKMKVQIFNQHEPPIVASAERLILRLSVSMLAIGVVCVLWLGWLGRGYAWEVKKPGGIK
jgi:hypothetical protein